MRQLQMVQCQLLCQLPLKRKHASELSPVYVQLLLGACGFVQLQLPQLK